MRLREGVGEGQRGRGTRLCVCVCVCVETSRENGGIGTEAVVWPDFFHPRTHTYPHTHQREPLQYVIGEWDFRNLTLDMRPPVLIPRPETEVRTWLLRFCAPFPSCCLLDFMHKLFCLVCTAVCLCVCVSVCLCVCSVSVSVFG